MELLLTVNGTQLLQRESEAPGPDARLYGLLPLVKRAFNACAVAANRCELISGLDSEGSAFGPSWTVATSGANQRKTAFITHSAVRGLT